MSTVLTCFDTIKLYFDHQYLLFEAKNYHSNPFEISWLNYTTELVTVIAARDHAQDSRLPITLK